MSTSAIVSKFQILQSRAQSAQFVLDLHPLMLVPIEIGAAAIGKSPSTFRSDLCRRPQSLPRVTRRGGRVLLRVQDILDWLNDGPPPPAPSQAKRGRPTKSEQLARAAAAAAAAARGAR